MASSDGTEAVNRVGLFLEFVTGKQKADDDKLSFFQSPKN